MKKIIFGVILSSLFLISMIHAEQVTFNGKFNPGVTLYSDWYFINQTFAKDVYPIRGIQFCETQQKCSIYNYHYIKTCIKFNQRGQCSIYKTTKITDNCKTYTNIQVCKNTKSYAAICYNPKGLATNQLSLNNFFYSTDGINWNQVKYGYNYYPTIEAQFKVVIPSVCTPTYDINKAITLN
jgi:hypothetical protein